jgi:hypothetical protein
VNNLKLAQSLLHRDLIELGQFALHNTARMLQEWDSGKYDKSVFLAHKVFEQIEDDIELLLELPKVDENVALSEATVKQLGRCLAVATYVFLSVKYHQGRLASPPTIHDLLPDHVYQEERRYARLLMQSRQAARQRHIGLIYQTFHEGLDVIRVELNHLAHLMAGQPPTVKRASVAAVRVGSLARKYAMFLPACLHLMLRLTNTRRSAGLQQVALRREQLLRSTASWLTAQAHFPDAEPDDFKRIVAEVQAISWVDEDPGYTSITVAAGAVTELRVVRRNAMRAGIAQGSWVLTEGRIRQAGDQTFLEASLVGITDYAREVWEDYLAVQIRPIYNLYPRSLNIISELPNLEALSARNDLHGRL